jgi:transposase InsO family protein
MSTITQLLKRIYYDPSHSASYGTAKKLFLAAKKIRKKITRKQVTKFLEKQETYTLHRPIRKKFKRRKTLARGLDNIWQIDLVDLGSIQAENRGFRYILTVIDVLSRYAFAKPIRDKQSKTVVSAFKHILKHSGRAPLKLHSDFGKEFYGYQFKRFLRERKIIHYSTYSETKASLVERFNRTLQSRLYKYFTAKQTLHYLRALPEFVKSYNATIHSAHGFAPNKITKRNQKLIWEKLYGTYLKQRPSLLSSQLKQGDFVRITKWRSAFAKAYLKGWTGEIFIIHEINRTIPLTYKIKDLKGELIHGSFYKEELTRVSI